MASATVEQKGNDQVMRRISTRLSYANVMATIAVFLALGGGAFAASKLGKNVIKSKNIAPKAVKTSDLHNGAVKTAKLATNAVDTSKIANSAVTGSKIAATKFSAVSGFTNGWGSGLTAPQFGTDPLGFVHLRGTIAGGTDNTAGFTLPAGFRPSAIRDFATTSGFATECTIEVNTGGAVTPTGCNNLFVSLDPITFQAEG
jgi:uncharacterized membrane protein